MTTRIAIPVFEQDIAPRFGFARRFLVLELEGRRIVGQTDLRFDEPGCRRRLARLARRGVSRLVCGGFNRRFLPFTRGLGIEVSWGHTGAVEDLVAQLREAPQGGVVGPPEPKEGEPL